MKQYTLNGTVTGIGYTSTERKENLITLLKKEGIDYFDYFEMIIFKQDPSKMAKEKNEHIIVLFPLKESAIDRLTTIFDFRGYSVEERASRLIGISEAGITINKNRFGVIGEINEKELVETLKKHRF